MASPVTLTRLAFRPLSTRIQCRYASGDALASTTTRSGAGALAGELLRRLDPSAKHNMAKPALPIGATDRSADRGSVREMEQFSRRKGEQERADAQVAEINRVDLEKMQGRKWAVGDVYAPHDLTHIEQKRWRTPKADVRKTVDVFDQLGINPILEYKNFALMAEYVSETGRIKPRSQTGLRPVNQRRMAKAIRRAIGCGLMPRTYKHPMLLMRDRPTVRRARIAQERGQFERSIF